MQIYRDFINIESEISQILMKCFEISITMLENVGRMLGISGEVERRLFFFAIDSFAILIPLSLALLNAAFIFASRIT